MSRSSTVGATGECTSSYIGAVARPRTACERGRTEQTGGNERKCCALSSFFFQFPNKKVVQEKTTFPAKTKR